MRMDAIEFDVQTESAMFRSLAGWFTSTHGPRFLVAGSPTMANTFGAWQARSAKRHAESMFCIYGLV